MSKYGLLPLCLILSLFLLACEQSGGSTSTPQKIGVVNLNRLMVDSDAGRAAAKYVEQLQNELRTKLTAMQKQAEQGKSEAEQSEQAEEALQKEAQLAYAKVQAEQQNVQNILNDVLHRTVEQYRREHNFSLIVFSEVVLSFDEKLDVTGEITKAMNQEKVEFKPLPEAKPAQTQTEPKTEQAGAKDAAKDKTEDKSAKDQKKASAAKEAKGEEPKKP